MKHLQTFKSFLSETNENKNLWKVAYAGKGFYGITDGGPIEGEWGSEKEAQKHADKRNSINKKYESENIINESEIFVSDKKFQDEITLNADILKNIGPALTTFLKKYGINYGPFTAKDDRGGIRLESKPLTGKDLGIMQYGFKEVRIDTFGKGSFPRINKAAGDIFEFEAFIAFDLHYSYNHAIGSNSTGLILPGENTSYVFYDVINRKFLKASEVKK